MVVLVSEPAPRLIKPGALPIAGLAVAAMGVAALANPDTIEDGPVICPFRLMTGLPCPGCGLTRSWVYLVHGQWQDSLVANPFGAVLFVLAVGFVVATAVSGVRRRPLPDGGRLIRSWPVKVIGVAWALFGIGRVLAISVGG